MQQIINFLIRNKNFLLFLLLLFVSLILTIQSHRYHRSKFISSANFLTGGIYGWKYSIGNYFGLKDENERLLKENENLRNQISWLTADTIATQKVDTTSFDKPYTYIKGNVYKNDYISILNSNSGINAGLKNSNQYGSLVWNGKDPNIVQLETVPRQAILKKGDTIITNGRSTIFPRGIEIGTILHYELDENQSYFLIDVQLFNDMTDIGFVYAIKSNDVAEIQSLENPKNDE